VRSGVAWRIPKHSHTRFSQNEGLVVRVHDQWQCAVNARASLGPPLCDRRKRHDADDIARESGESVLPVSGDAFDAASVPYTRTYDIVMVMNMVWVWTEKGLSMVWGVRGKPTGSLPSTHTIGGMRGRCDPCKSARKSESESR